MTRLIAVFVVTLLLGGAFVAGAGMVHFDTPPYRMLQTTLHKLRPAPALTAPAVAMALDLPDERIEYDYETILMRLTGREITVPIEDWGTGGNVAPFADGALLMTHEGRFFWSDGPDSLRRLPIVLPDHGLRDFVHYAVTYLPDATSDFNVFRYNDVLAIPAGDAATHLAVSYTDFDLDARCYATVVVRSTEPVPHALIGADPPPPVEWTELFRTEPCLEPRSEGPSIAGHMAGARMALGPEGDIYIAMGDYYFDGELGPPLAQFDDNDYGKTLRIDPETGEAATVSKGHRNPQGLAFDDDGALYLVEHAARGGDELNLIRPGLNYGAPLETLGTDYNMQAMPLGERSGRHEQFEAPVYAFLPSVAISTLNRVGEGFHDGWDGDFILATLKDQSIFRLRIEDRRVMLAERIEIGQRVRAALPLGDRLVLWTDNHQLIWLQPRALEDVSDLVSAVFAQLPLEPTVMSRARTVLAACQECHSLRPGPAEGAPTLAGIGGADIASRDYDAYSDALLSAEGVWTRARLSAYLDDPQAIAPGTVMPRASIDDPAVKDALIEFLFALPDGS